MKRYYPFIILLAVIMSSAIYAEKPGKNASKSFFKDRITQRIYTGFYSSCFDDNICLLQTGYDGALRLMNISPDYNLIDFGLGIDVLCVFDQVNEEQTDNLGHIRPSYARITPGLELNWNVRLYLIPVPVINCRIYLEGQGMTLVVYAREFPDAGTQINIGSHAGFGFEYPVGKGKAYTSLRLFHSSNGQTYEHNPALIAVGIITGVQF